VNLKKRVKYKNPLLYINNNYEQITTIKKIYNQHWLLQGLPVEFKVSSKNTWDPHPVNIKLENLHLLHSNYRVLATSLRGPQIAEHENTICVQFDITKKYPETLGLLENFLKKHIPETYVYFLLI
jgi:hypothetical protein